MTNTEITGTKKDEGRVSLDDINLQVGTRIQLITYGSKKHEYFSSLIGFESDRYIFIRMPQENGFNVPLKIAERVDIRIFTGVSILSFPSCVQYIYQTPRNFVELAYPDNIRVMPLRKDIRIMVKMPVRVWHLRGEKLENTLMATARDLSITGVMLEGNVNLGEIGDEIGVSFSIRNTLTEENILIEAMATIRNNRREVDDCGNIVYRKGVLFRDLRPFHRATLQGFINDFILAGRNGATPPVADHK